MGMLHEFRKFIMRGNVVDLAVGVVIGAAFGKIIGSMVEDIFTPILGMIAGGVDFSGLGVEVGSAKIAYGKFIQATFNFLIIGFCMFLVVKGMNKLQSLQAKEEAPPPDPTPSEKLLAEIRDLLKERPGDRPPGASPVG
jgi:large conductance mechanosensitive channel